MRKGMFLGEHILLSNKEWRDCLRRVDVRGAVAGSDEWFIHVKCPFCKSGGRPCLDAECPLTVYLSEETRYEWGCVIMFKLVRKELGVEGDVSLYDDYISWSDEVDKDARTILNYIYAGLLSMKTTNRRK